MILFEYAFLQKALLAGILAGLAAPLLGQFLVVRRMPLLADTLSHVSLVGVAAALALGVNPLLGAGVFALFSGFAMERLRQSRRISSDSTLALFLSGGLALAVLVASFSPVKNAGLFSYLFGSLVTVSSVDLWVMLGILLVLACCVAVAFRQLVLVSFSEELAEANGLRSKTYSLGIVLLAALAVVVSLRVVGVLLIGALMVIPVSAAMQAGMGFMRTLVLSVVLSLVSVVAGLWLSFVLDLPSGAMIVVSALVIFIGSLIYKKIAYG